MKKPLIILTGPTAVGKTELSIKLAKAVNGEIISADSMQVYRGMDIGTAKITKEEMEDIPHHLIDIMNPGEDFSVYTFKKLAKEAMEGIYERGHIPIITGGTGFYIQALLYDIDFEENKSDDSYRNALYEIAEKEGNEKLYEMLKTADPEYAKIVHPNNIKRVVRALEYFHETQKPLSKTNEDQRQRQSPYNFIYLVLNDEREALYEKIDKRVDIMLENGLVDEVKALKNAGCDKSLISMKALGYKEILDYLNGDITYEEAVFIIKRDTRHFAKRQLTWFRREKDVTYINLDEFLHDKGKILEHILMLLKERGITK